jgi:hypothetical protein
LLINDDAGRSRTDNSKSTGVCLVSKIWTFVAFLDPWFFLRWSRGCNTQGTPEYSHEVRNQINLLKPSVLLTCVCLKSRLFSYDLGHRTSTVHHRTFRDVTPGLWGG